MSVQLNKIKTLNKILLIGLSFSWLISIANATQEEEARKNPYWMMPTLFGAWMDHSPAAVSYHQATLNQYLRLSYQNRPYVLSEEEMKLKTDQELKDYMQVWNSIASHYSEGYQKFMIEYHREYNHAREDDAGLPALVFDLDETVVTTLDVPHEKSEQVKAILKEKKLFYRYYPLGTGGPSAGHMPIANRFHVYRPGVGTFMKEASEDFLLFIYTAAAASHAQLVTMGLRDSIFETCKNEIERQRPSAGTTALTPQEIKEDAGDQTQSIMEQIRTLHRENDESGRTGCYTAELAGWVMPTGLNGATTIAAEKKQQIEKYISDQAQKHLSKNPQRFGPKRDNLLLIDDLNKNALFAALNTVIISPFQVLDREGRHYSFQTDPELTQLTAECERLKGDSMFEKLASEIAEVRNDLSAHNLQKLASNMNESRNLANEMDFLLRRTYFFDISVANDLINRAQAILNSRAQANVRPQG